MRPSWLATGGLATGIAAMLAMVATLGMVDPSPALAHSRSQSFSTWRISDDGDVRISFSVAAREVTRLASLVESDEFDEFREFDLGELMASHLARQVTVRGAGQNCSTVGAPLPLTARQGHVRVEWRFVCPPDAELEISLAVFFDIAPSHVHFARVFVGDAHAAEYLFTDAARTRLVPAAETFKGAGLTGAEATATTTFGAYVALGVAHILAGLDHLAFLLALLLLSRRVREVALLVTGFTLGHSVTLSLAALGVVEPDIVVVEALIGFTIALVAAEAIGVATGASARVGAVGAAGLSALAVLSLLEGVGPPVTVLAGLALFTFCYLSLARTRELAIRLSPALTTVFGLVHGFGFASVLAQVGLPSDRLLPALFGFNLGVELGQLAAVALAWASGVMLVRAAKGRGTRFAAELMSAALCGLGLFWFVERAYGG